MPYVNGKDEIAETSSEYLMMQEILNTLRDPWVEKYKTAENPVVFSQMSVLALQQFAAVLAVDVGMPQDKWLNVCTAFFNEAYAKAPKFGP